MTVAISRSSGDSDLTLGSSSLTLTTANRYIAQEVIDSAADNGHIVDGEATIRHTTSGGDYGSITANVTATEDDNETPAFSFSMTSVTVPEGAATAYSVRLAYRPGADVRVALARADHTRVKQQTFMAFRVQGAGTCSVRPICWFREHRWTG